MKDLEKFINIFEGLDIAYGITKKSDEINEKGKNVTKSFTITKTPLKISSLSLPGVLFI